MKKKKAMQINVDPEDIVITEDCGCYVHEGYNAGDRPYVVFCNLHEAAPKLLAACKLALEGFRIVAEKHHIEIDVIAIEDALLAAGEEV